MVKPRTITLAVTTVAVGLGAAGALALSLEDEGSGQRALGAPAEVRTQVSGRAIHAARDVRRHSEPRRGPVGVADDREDGYEPERGEREDDDE